MTATDADSVSYGDIQYSLEGSGHEDFAIYERRQGNVRSYLSEKYVSFSSVYNLSYPF